MQKEYYKIKFENGEITVMLFDKDNPIPHTHYKGKINSEKTIIFLDEIYNRIYDRQMKFFIKSFIKLGKEYSNRIKQDFD